MYVHFQLKTPPIAHQNKVARHNEGAIPFFYSQIQFHTSDFLHQRSNADSEQAFNDQRYNNSLEKCMQTELKKDKFRNAVLLALEEKRMSESEKLSIELVRRDAQDLYRALMAKEGGETAMINIIIVRSDKHLGEVLRVFESQYRKNFAREMIQKSRNLVVRWSLPQLLIPID